MMARSGAWFSTKWLIFSEMSKIITMPMMSSSAMKNVIMNFLMMYQSIFLILRFISLLYLVPALRSRRGGVPCGPVR